MGAIEEILEEARPFACQTLAVATSVFREAANGRAFADAVRKRFDVPVDLLTGIEEARLSCLGAISDLPPSRRPVAVIDVGGGSIQLTVGEGQQCLLATSLPLGVLRLCERAASADDARAAARTIATTVRQEAASATRAVAALDPGTFVFASGTARAIASLALLDRYEATPPPRRADNPRGTAMATRVSRAGLRGLGAGLLGRDARALNALGVPADRHASAGAGAIVLETLMDLLGTEEATIATRALREGVIVRALHDTRGARRPPPCEAMAPQ
jgi:exopolyphosphatase/guanosine-5'-triphosphate,3'-diphosphate pyrophosphatase